MLLTTTHTHKHTQTTQLDLPSIHHKHTQQQQHIHIIVAHTPQRMSTEFTQRVDAKEYGALFKKLVKQLRTHKSSERKQSAPTDKVLLGVLEMVTVLLRAVCTTIM